MKPNTQSGSTRDAVVGIVALITFGTSILGGFAFLCFLSDGNLFGNSNSLIGNSASFTTTISGVLLAFIAPFISIFLLGRLLRWIQRENSHQTVSDIPLRAQYLLLLIPQKDREFILGDLEEEFRTILLPQYGLQKARAYYWWHTLASITPFIFRLFKRALGVAVILKLIGR